MPAEEGAKLIAHDILREAEEKAAGVIREAERERAMLLDSARMSAKEEGEREVEEALARGRQVYEELMAKGRVEAKKEVLQKKEELIAGVFKSAEEKLRAHVRSKQYEKDLLRIAVDACGKLGSGGAIIRANQRDLELLKRFAGEMERELSGGGKTVRISFGEPIQTIGGVVVSSPDGKVEIDETFEGRIRREFEVLRVKVAKVLFEGSG